MGWCLPGSPVSEGESGVPPHGRADDRGGNAGAPVPRVTSGRSRHHLILQPWARSTCQCHIQCDCIKNGGLTEFAKVAAYCEARGVLLAPHHVPHFHVQIAAAYPQTAWIEVFDNFKQHVAWLDLFPGYPETHDGHIEVLDRPGWGFELNESFLRDRGTLVHWRS